MFMKILEAAAKKVTKDLKAFTDNTEGALNAFINNDSEKLDEISSEFVRAAAIGTAAVAMKKAGFGIVTSLYNGDDVVDALADTFSTVNPVVATVIGANLVMAGATKLIANEKRRLRENGLARRKAILERMTEEAIHD